MNAPRDADAILRMLRRVGRCLSERSHRLSREAGLTVPQSLCLRAISALGPDATVASVGRRVDMGPPTVSGILDRLERQGLVRRERGTEDRRRVYVRLTDAGDDRIATLPSPLHDSFLERLEALPEAERTRISDVLSSVVAMMEDGRPDH